MSLQECSYRLTVGRQGTALFEHLGFTAPDGLQIGRREMLVDELLRAAHYAVVVGSNHCRCRYGFFEESLVGHHPIHEAHALGFLRVYVAAGEDEVRGVAKPNEQREEIARRELRHEADSREAEGEHGPVRCDTEVADERPGE